MDFLKGVAISDSDYLLLLGGGEVVY